MSASSEPSTSLPRSSRARVKSQRALDSEFTDRLFTRAKDKPVNEAETSQVAKGNTKTKTKGKAPKKRGGKGKKQEVYCVCRSDGTDGRPMIECGECTDWFHFDCVHLTEHEAERIRMSTYFTNAANLTNMRADKYVCPGCEKRTGEKTTQLYDISTFPSPSPPPGFTKVAAKRKFKKKASSVAKSHSNTPDAPSESDSDDEGSEANGESGSESTGSAASASSSKRPAAKRLRPQPPTKDVKPKREYVDRKPSISIPPPNSGTEPLPKARQHVQVRMTEVIKGLFADALGDQEAAMYADKLEAALWASCKEMVNGKEAPGSRYKAQFSLLSSSLSRSLRPELRASILDHTLSPAQVAVLTPAELASAERLEEIERAKQAVLQQTVKSRGDVEVAAVRLGRDGFEKVEDRHEKEMKMLAIQEEAARVTEKRRESMVSHEETVEDSPRMTRERESDERSPVMPLHKRSESLDTAQSPTKRTFALTSAWGEAKEEEDAPLLYEGDQSALDLSDIAAEPEEAEFVPDVVEEVVPSEMELFEAKPTVWSGGIVNPAAPSPHVPVMSARLVSGSNTQQTSVSWPTLLPQNPIAITGRVPTDKALRYLSDSRLSPTKELIVVAFGRDLNVSEEEKKTWEEMVEYHINRDRHGIYLPFGSGRVPPNAAKEVYLVPLRPSDPSPDFTDLIDGYSLPSTRTSHIFLGVFIISKETVGTSPTRSQSSSIVPPAMPPPAPTPAAIQNDQLKALMASLNPAALQGILAPPAPPPSAPMPVLPSAPFSTAAYQPTTPTTQEYNPPYRPPPVPYQAGRSPMQQQGSWDSRGMDGRSRSPDRGARNSFGLGGGRGSSRESDNGWGSRGRGSGGRY